MAIIYTYPTKASPAADDLILISDSADSNKTKQIKVSSLPSSGAGITLTTTGTSGPAELNGTVLNIPNYTTTGGTPATPLNSVQFNNASAFGGSENFKYNNTNSTLTIGDNAVGNLPGVLELKAGPSATPSLKIQDLVNQNFITIRTAEDTSNSYTIYLPDDGPGTGNKILQSDANGELSWINTPTESSLPIEEEGSQITAAAAKINFTGTGATASASGNNVTVNVPAMSIENNGSAFTVGITTLDFGTNLAPVAGGPGSNKVTITASNTNIANTNLQLDNNRTLDLNDNGTARSLTFINTNNGSKNLFKFDQIGGTSPRFTVGHAVSAYEGYVVLEGNGSNRTGQVQFQNAAGDYFTSIQAPNTFGASQNITYVLPNLQGAANSVLTNNGSGTLSWTTTSEPAEITATTAANPTTFAATPFRFANTNSGSGTGAPVATQVGSSAGNKHISFYYGTTFSGGINQNGTSTVNYATSSDYRLKENVVEMTGAIYRVKQLKPSRFNFVSDGPSRTVDGFLAHEVSSIVPEAVTGSKDAVDAEGNIIPQGIDQSKLVPLLVGAIKELTARIEALEA